MMEDAHFHPSKILTAFEGLDDAVDCYKHFDKREAGWLKIELVPGDENPVTFGVLF